MFRVDSGASIELRGVDLVVPEGLDETSAMFGLAAGAELSLSRCTVTVVGNAGPLDEAASVVRIGPADDPFSASAAALIRFEDSLIRAGGNVVDVASGGRSETSVINSIVVCAGSVIHGRGSARAAAVAPLKIALRQSTLQAATGLLWLESAPGQPELPQAEIVARESILSTGSSDAPLLRVDGQDGLDELRDRVTWESRGIVYHQINTYRRDVSSQAGTSPVGFRRLSWEVAVGNHEESPYHGDARFLRPWPSGRAPWTATPEDFRLAPASPAAGAGPQVDQIAGPPRLDE
jgi:hypothetical protein